MALADEALPHLVVLIGLVTTFGETNSRELVHGVEALHELFEGPNFFGVQKVFEEFQDSLRLVDAYQWMT